MFAIFLTLLQMLSVCVKCTDFIGHLQQIYTHLLHRAHLVNGFCAHDNCTLVNQHLCRSVPTNEILSWWRHFFQNCFSSQFVWLAVISPNLLINMHELLSAKVSILPWSLNLSIITHYFESIWNEGSMKTTDNPDITPDFKWFSKKKHLKCSELRIIQNLSKVNYFEMSSLINRSPMFQSCDENNLGKYFVWTPLKPSTNDCIWIIIFWFQFQILAYLNFAKRKMQWKWIKIS